MRTRHSLILRAIILVGDLSISGVTASLSPSASWVCLLVMTLAVIGSSLSLRRSFDVNIESLCCVSRSLANALCGDVITSFYVGVMMKIPKPESLSSFPLGIFTASLCLCKLQLPKEGVIDYVQQDHYTKQRGSPRLLVYSKRQQLSIRHLN